MMRDGMEKLSYILTMLDTCALAVDRKLRAQCRKASVLRGQNGGRHRGPYKRMTRAVPIQGKSASVARLPKRAR